TAAAVGGHPERVKALTAAGAALIEGSGDLRADLRALVPLEISTLLLEGGALMHAAAWRAGVIDRVHVIVAPTALGAGGVKFFDGIDVPLSELIPVRVEMLGPDAWMEADV